MKRFDLIIIGGGAGAFGAAIRAEELGANTAMINAGLPLGGTCVNVGCVPSKTLLRAGEIMHLSEHHGIPGIDIAVKKFDFSRVIGDELALAESLRREKYETVLKNLEHVTFIEGAAQFVSAREITVNGESYSADSFIIATGSTAAVPAIDGIKDTGFITHIESLKGKQQPRDLIVVGAGPLGLEFSQMFGRFGTQVTLLQRGPSVFPRGERVLTKRLEEILTQEGIIVETNVELRSARREGGRKIISYHIDGRQKQASGDAILLAAGKVPNTGNLGLIAAAVETDARKAIVTNGFYRTSQPHIYAVGDVTSLPVRLETTAAHEGTLAAENALTGTHKSIDYTTVPYTIFTDPQLAGVGFTEEKQMEKLGLCACRTVSFEHVPKAVITRRTEGMIKMAIHPDTRQIHGVHILAPHAGELIAGAMMLVKNKNTIDDVTGSLPMFPTLSEAIKLAALSFTKDISRLSCCI